MFLSGKVYLKLEQRAGLFLDKSHKWGGSLWNRGKGEGLMAKLPSPSSPSRWETGEASPCVGGGRFGRPGPRRRPGVREKGARGTWGSIPQLTSAWGAAR